MIRLIRTSYSTCLVDQNSSHKNVSRNSLFALYKQFFFRIERIDFKKTLQSVCNSLISLFQTITYCCSIYIQVLFNKMFILAGARHLCHAINYYT